MKITVYLSYYLLEETITNMWLPTHQPAMFAVLFSVGNKHSEESLNPNSGYLWQVFQFYGKMYQSELWNESTNFWKQTYDCQNYRIFGVEITHNNPCIGLFMLSMKKVVTIDDQTSNMHSSEMKSTKSSHYVCNLIRNMYTNTKLKILNVAVIWQIVQTRLG